MEFGVQRKLKWVYLCRSDLSPGLERCSAFDIWLAIFQCDFGARLSHGVKLLMAKSGSFLRELFLKSK